MNFKEEKIQRWKRSHHITIYSSQKNLYSRSKDPHATQKDFHLVKRIDHSNSNRYSIALPNSLNMQPSQWKITKREKIFLLEIEIHPNKQVDIDTEKSSVSAMASFAL